MSKVLQNRIAELNLVVEKLLQENERLHKVISGKTTRNSELTAENEQLLDENEKLHDVIAQSKSYVEALEFALKEYTTSKDEYIKAVKTELSHANNSAKEWEMLYEAEKNKSWWTKLWE